MCLHGFPDTSNTFRLMAPFFGHLGYRVVVPAMRGYAPRHSPLRATTTSAHSPTTRTNFTSSSRATNARYSWAMTGVPSPRTSLPTANRRAGTGRSRWPYLPWRSWPDLSRAMSNCTPVGTCSSSRVLWPKTSSRSMTCVPPRTLAGLVAAVRPFERVRAPSRALTSPENLHAASVLPLHVRASQHHTRLVNLPSVPTLYLHGSLDGCFLASSLTDVLESLAPHSKFTLVENAGTSCTSKSPTSCIR